MKIGVLTSSRADFGIYLPLLQKMKNDSFFEIDIIAFGTHLSKMHGFTISEIVENNFKNIHKLSTLLTNDYVDSIVTSYGLTIIKFSHFWQLYKFDLVLCLGDRFEMSAAVQAGIPFGVKFAHIHGGETTIGAIDNIYRHQISLASKIHFTSNDLYSKRVSQLINSNKNIINVGSLSLNDIETFEPIKKEIFYDILNITKEDFALINIHPETINIESNKQYAFEIYKALRKLLSNIYLVITMPNADTLGSVFRDVIKQLHKEFPNNIIIIENFGKINYFNAMYYSKILIGNTSSGIIEAASFGKYVVNIGDRQKGRVKSENIFETPFAESDIINSVNQALIRGKYLGTNIYYKSGTVDLIINYLKDLNGNF